MKKKKYFLLLLVPLPFLLFGILTGTSKQERTRELAPLCYNQYESAPKCPLKDGKVVLPRTYRAESIYVGYTYDPAHFDFLKILIEKVKSIKNPPKVNILIPRTQVELAKGQLDFYLEQESYHFINLLPGPSDETLWPQDYFEFIFDLKTKKNQFFDLPYLDREGEFIPSALSLMCKQKLIEQTQVYSKENPPANGDFGGNIEAISSEILLVGDNITPETLYLLKGNTTQEIKVLNVSWLETGHVDELFSLLPHRENASPCDQTLFYASPALALNLLMEEPISQVPADVSFRRYHQEYDSWQDFSYCLHIKNRNIPQCKSFIEANNTYELIQWKNIEVIQQSFERIHQCKLPVLASPQLFSPKQTQSAYGTYDDRSVALNANSVNNIFFWPELLLPGQSIPIFQKYLEKNLRPFKFQKTFVNGEFVHSMMGGIHCASNVAYSCR